MTRYTQHPIDDDGWTSWHRLRPEADGGFRVSCCDCFLVHDMQFRVREDGEIVMRARRNERATAAKRRHAANRGTDMTTQPMNRMVGRNGADMPNTVRVRNGEPPLEKSRKPKAPAKRLTLAEKRERGVDYAE